MGGDSAPGLTALSRSLGEFEEEKKGSGEGAHRPPSPKDKPSHREYSCGKIKNVLLFKE